MTGAEKIAAFAAEVFSKGVPQEVLESAQLHFLDAIGVGIASSSITSNAGWAKAASPGEASLLTGAHAEPGAAAMINGALIHALEFDDTHIGSVVHGSAVAAPLALAAVQLVGATGRDLILAYVVAWEVAIRIGLAAPGKFQARGFQVTSVGGAIGAAAAAAQVLGLNRDQTISAIGIAGGQASGTLAFLADGATSKALNPGWAARTGINAAQFAQAGMTGPSSVFESDFGVMKAFADVSEGLEKHLSTLGTDWLLPQAAFKLYPCCHYIHPFLEAVECVIAQGAKPEEIRSLTAKVPPPTTPLICDPWERRQAPSTGYDGKWGLAYCMALMFVDGHVGVESFESQPRADVIALAQRMSWVPMQSHGFPTRFAASIEVETSRGRIDAEVEQVLGAPDRPVEAERIHTKFATNASRKYSPEKVSNLSATILGIAALHDLRDFANLLKS